MTRGVLLQSACITLSLSHSRTLPRAIPEFQTYCSFLPAKQPLHGTAQPAPQSRPHAHMGPVQQSLGEQMHDPGVRPHMNSPRQHSALLLQKHRSSSGQSTSSPKQHPRQPFIPKPSLSSPHPAIQHALHRHPSSSGIAAASLSSRLNPGKPVVGLLPIIW